MDPAGDFGGLTVKREHLFGLDQTEKVNDAILARGLGKALDDLDDRQGTEGEPIVLPTIGCRPNGDCSVSAAENF